MNNTYFLHLIRRDSAVQLTIHLAAGILALLLITGIARAENPSLAKAPATESVALHR